MLSEGAATVLTLIGKAVHSPGIIEVHEMDTAILMLEAAVSEHAKTDVDTYAKSIPLDNERVRLGTVTQDLNRTEGRVDAPANKSEDYGENRLDPVTVKQRVIPFLQMLKSARKHNYPVVWGV